MSKIKDPFERCIIEGTFGCINCKYLYKDQCLVVLNGDLDYLKAMVDLVEEFPSVVCLNENEDLSCF